MTKATSKCDSGCDLQQGVDIEDIEIGLFPPDEDGNITGEESGDEDEFNPDHLPGSLLRTNVEVTAKISCEFENPFEDHEKDEKKDEEKDGEKNGEKNEEMDTETPKERDQPSTSYNTPSTSRKKRSLHPKNVMVTAKTPCEFENPSEDHEKDEEKDEKDTETHKEQDQPSTSYKSLRLPTSRKKRERVISADSIEFKNDDNSSIIS